jgi:energy-coupling factor transport system ATP-binding protein
MALVSIRHFSYTYPGAEAPALQDINLEIEQGSFVVVTGKSGCGKSTLGKALAGFLFQDENPNYSGEILVNGTAMDQAPLYSASERVAYVQQNPEDQFCTLTVQDEIAFGLENRCVDPQKIAQEIRNALDVVNGSDLIDRPLAGLSGGEKQKVAIASMLALSPDVLILDEPTSNLDPIATRNVFTTLHHMLKNRKITVIIIEHKLSQLVSLDPQWVIMDQGQILPGMQVAGFIEPHPEPNAMIREMSPKLTQTEPIVHLANVSLMRQGKTILSDITLDLFSGEFISLMGANGSGKTTLLHTMMGLTPYKEGSLTLFGRDVTKTKTSDLVSQTGFIFQNPDHMLFTQSVWDETVFTARNLKLLTPELVNEAEVWLDQLGMSGSRFLHPNRLSYGEKRRLNLVSALLHHPNLLLVDELLIGQDMQNAHLWMATLSEYAAKGNTVLLVNHHPELTQKYCDRILMLDNGQLVIDAPVEDAFFQMEVLGKDAFLPARNEAFAYA